MGRQNIQFKEGLFNADLCLASVKARQFLQGWMDRFVAWVKRHNGNRPGANIPAKDNGG